MLHTTMVMSPFHHIVNHQCIAKEFTVKTVESSTYGTLIICKVFCVAQLSADCAQNLGRTTDEHRLDADTGYIMINHKWLKLQAVQQYDACADNDDRSNGLNVTNDSY